MRRLVILFTFFALSNCSEKPKDKDDDLYLIIDEITRYAEYHTDLVVLELNKIRINTTVVIDFNGDTVTMTPPLSPPLGNDNFYDKELFERFENDSLLNSKEAEFMYNSISRSNVFILDSLKIEKKTIHLSKINSLKKYGIDSTFQYLKKYCNASSYTQISTPVFSEDGNKVLLTIDNYCGVLCGAGSTYLLEKKNRKWRIIYAVNNWVS